MKLFVVFSVLVTIACAYAASAPQAVYDGPVYELKPIEGSAGESHMVQEMAAEPGSEGLAPIRHRRVTCDVLSFATLWLTVNDAACATRCLAQGRRGGKCQDGVCVCR